jgi:hypothetical protein
LIGPDQFAPVLSTADIASSPLALSLAMHNGSETDSEPPVPMKTLAACESTSVTDTLARVVEKSTRGRTLGIQVFKVDPRRLRNTADKRFCAALLWTSAGKQVVNYTVEWMNRETGQFWVEFRWM